MMFILIFDLFYVRLITISHLVDTNVQFVYVERTFLIELTSSNIKQRTSDTMTKKQRTLYEV